MKRYILIAIALFVSSILVTPESKADKRGSETRKVKNFSKISASAGVDVILIQGNKEEAIVEADSDIMEYVKTEVDGETLELTLKRRSFFNSWRNRKVKITVYYKNINGISSSAGADVNTENTLKGKILGVSVSSGADVDLEVDVETIAVSTSSGSDADIRGKTDNVKCSASSGSDINCKNLDAKHGKASVSSGADIELTATKSFSGSASSGGDIDVYGNPERFNKNTSSGGDISKR